MDLEEFIFIQETERQLEENKKRSDLLYENNN